MPLSGERNPHTPFSAVTCGTRRKLQTPGTAEEQQRQETPTINPIDRQPIHLIDQAPSIIERAAWEAQTTISQIRVPR